MIVSPNMREALRDLHDCGGEGALTPGGCILANGEIRGPRCDGIVISAYGPALWLKLVSLGFIERAGDGWLRVSFKGREAVRFSTSP